MKIAAVSYTNTIPFIYGLTQYPGIAEKTDLLLLPPASCAEAWLSGEADMALVPVGAMSREDLAQMCCQWCIGAEGAVESVLLLSDEPLQNLKTLYLDTESRTSVLMTAILCKNLWHIAPEMKSLRMKPGFRPETGTGMVLIGDKTFGLAGKFLYSIDLASAWQQLTGLPAVFACWLNRKQVSTEIKHEINEAFGWGIAHIREAVEHAGNLQIQKDEAVRYLTQCISFRLGEAQKEAIQTFFTLRDAL